MQINNSNDITTRCGFVAIVGRPNVGKSTLLNYLIGEKISITADKPQTTRHQIVGVKTVGNEQIIIIDTPGMHLRQKKAINREMNKAAKNALQDVDAVIFMVEALEWNEEDQLVLDCLEHIKAPVLLLVNKIDMVKNKDDLLPFLTMLGEKIPSAEIIPCSATMGTQVEIIEKKILALLPVAPFYYPADQTTDKSIQFRLAEIIREKLTRVLSEELPYALSVEIERMQQEETQLVVHAIIWVERDSQKAIVIGKKGAVLKEVGQQARLDMNHLLKTSVHLVLWVKVKAGWSDDKKALKNLGYLDLS